MLGGEPGVGVGPQPRLVGERGASGGGGPGGRREIGWVAEWVSFVRGGGGL